MNIILPQLEKGSYESKEDQNEIPQSTNFGLSNKNFGLSNNLDKISSSILGLGSSSNNNTSTSEENKFGLRLDNFSNLGGNTISTFENQSGLGDNDERDYNYYNENPGGDTISTFKNQFGLRYSYKSWIYDERDYNYYNESDNQVNLNEEEPLSGIDENLGILNSYSNPVGTVQLRSHLAALAAIVKRLDEIKERYESSEANLQQIGRDFEELAKQIAERLNRIKELLETYNPQQEISKYLVMNELFARLAVEDPGTYGEIITGINELMREIVENDQFREYLQRTLNEEELKLLLTIGLSSVKDGDDYNNVMRAAELLGFQPSEIFAENTEINLISNSVDQTEIVNEMKDSLAKELSKENPNRELVERYLEYITANENVQNHLKQLIDNPEELTNMYMSNPYLAHMLDIIAAKFIATGKLSPPPEDFQGPLGIYLVSALTDPNNKELREEFIAIVKSSEELQRALGIPQESDLNKTQKQLEEIKKQREEIINGIIAKHGIDNKDVHMILMALGKQERIT